MSENDKLNKIARDAEHDLNSYSAKTGSGKHHLPRYADTGINDTEKKFPGSTLKVGDDVITSASYNRRIPGDEGGDVDDKGRWIHGSAYEGVGGPEDKTAHVYLHNPGKIDETIVKGWGKNPVELEKGSISTEGVLPPEEAMGDARREPPHWTDVSEQGRRAARSNFGMTPENHGDLPEHGHKGSRYKGEFYETPESVPDQRADMNVVPPESTTGVSRNI
ncbi:hypothetical protein QBC38DRAFT_455308 [Podospora fimiseda]|uniref:Uncharacterized protein n=1 Tax=Podospora fimiseda TaxID=252190 RepID=A0AAN7BQQ4_9PEZI|nr:hypothetical protein QBC38DRAFT_455308 [Podospora fimiseda]